MSLEADKAVVRDFYDQAINGRDSSACERLLTTDFVHNGEQRGRDGQRQAVELFLGAFSPLQHEILIIFGEGKLVCAHRWSGKHVGDFLGHAATGREISFTSTAILELRDGQICGAWDEMDAAGLVAQIS